IKTIAAVFIFAVSLVLAGFAFEPKSNAYTQAGQNSIETQKPNIILMSTDGLNAESMSVYGYGRDTTPFISELAKSSLISENNFTNSRTSMGSLTAVLTSKLPFSTRVLYTPDTLRGADMYQHLPGLLKRNGYQNAQLAIRTFIDANALNMKNAFDTINCVENPSDSYSNLASGYGYDDEVFLLTTIKERIDDRIKHIFFIKDMQNPYPMVTQPDSFYKSDQNRLECLRSYLSDARKTGQPLFVQIHLMGTHGAKFYPSIRIFSKGENQDTEWMTDFYDDSILSFDSDVQQLVQYLKDNDQYDNTILILYSDHGQRWTTTDKLPLIIHFPGDQHAGIVKVNTQNIDIAPTILDYLGIDKPEWMEGSSLLGDLDPKRLIIAGGTNKVEKIDGYNILPPDKIKPPFYQFSNLFVTQCKNWYNIDLEDDMSVKQGEVKNYVNSCSADMMDSQEVIQEKVGEYLKQLGYLLPES
ncbi:sulfatase-like hydrolase/transferase, partial [bacterium]|nr:sulfatase-like hydrolase/transferase [bacterium]